MVQVNNFSITSVSISAKRSIENSMEEIKLVVR